jgi:hypothetical protein
MEDDYQGLHLNVRHLVAICPPLTLFGIMQYFTTYTYHHRVAIVICIVTGYSVMLLENQNIQELKLFLSITHNVLPTTSY